MIFKWFPNGICDECNRSILDCECYPINAESNLTPEVTEVPEDFKQGMRDFEEGNIVDLETALTEKPPCKHPDNLFLDQSLLE